MIDEHQTSDLNKILLNEHELTNNGQTEQLIQDLKLQLDSGTDSVQVSKKLCACYVTTGDFTKAERLVYKVIEAEPDNPECYFYLGKISCLKSNFDEAVHLFGQAMKLGMDKHSCLLGQGIAYFAKGSVSDALTIFNSLLQQKEEYKVKVLHYRALCLAALRRFDEALADIDLLQELGLFSKELSNIKKMLEEQRLQPVSNKIKVTNLP
ncbi:tetratricopeptide repeat protein [Vibrio sp. SCSIO 43137]|uniref:tetratricopeptide repeat protein n=1 Tax=Vibrio sp. SCSIO 43137 TaxID=3021011 RepID=UPI002307FEE0|nr:tetratricopeptide repeat protein [Vibrio sp. SCSIO 43137]WCE30560.1 tetratricopeptide repeat protein [Vibrio sp. SCSIO 43137]